MKKQSLRLLWVKDVTQRTSDDHQYACYKDCAFSASPVLEKLAETLSAYEDVIALAVYIVLLRKLFADHKIQIYLENDKLYRLENKIQVFNCNKFSELVKTMKLVELPNSKISLYNHANILTLTTSKNKILFCFETSYLENYLSSTMILRYRGLLKQIVANPQGQIDELEIAIMRELKIFKEWRRVFQRHKICKNKLKNIEQQIKLLPPKLLQHYSIDA